MSKQKDCREQENGAHSVIESPESKHAFHCLDLIRNNALRASKVHILPNYSANLAETKVRAPHDMAEEVLVVGDDHKYVSRASVSSTYSSLSSSSPAYASSYQGMLHCTWKDGVAHHVFSVDDANVVYIANVGASRDKDSDYVYTFHRREVDRLDRVGMMRVSTSITFCSDCSQTKETQFVLEEKDCVELAAVIVREMREEIEVGGWGLKFLRKPIFPCRRKNKEECSTSMDILIPAALHCGPRPSSLRERWISGGKCDCGGWDIACPITVLKAGSNQPDNSDGCKSIDLCVQGSKEDEPIMRIADIHEGLYYVHFKSNLSNLQSFAIAAAIIHSHSPLLR